MANSKLVEHTGTVKFISDKRVDVEIVQNSACSSCHAKQACSASDSSEKIISIYSWDGEYSLEESVVVTVTKSSGFKALFLGYIAPLILLFIVAGAVSIYVDSEIYVALSALFSLVPYFIMLWFYRDRLKEEFVFSVIKRKNK